MREEYQENWWRGDEYPLNFHFFSKSRDGELMLGQQVGFADTFFPGVLPQTILVWWGGSVRNVPQGMALK